MRICCYVSDHGYGHATRSIALVRALASQGGRALTIEVMNHHAHGLLRRALAPLSAVKVVDRPTDVGFVCADGRLAFDPGRTALSVHGWIQGWKRFVSEEVARLSSRPPDLVITDAAPEPLLVAEKLGARSVVASNFTWVDQYEPHLRPDLIAPLRGSYALAERGHAYPMRTAMAGVRLVVPAGLVTREPSLPRVEIRRRLGLGDSDRLVHLGFGWSADTAALGTQLDLAGLPRDVWLLVSRNLAGPALPGGWNERVLTIPPDDTEAHEYISACDLVVAKAGYGTAAEAIAGRVPILAVPVQGSRESEVIARTVAELGIGASYPSDPVVQAPVLDEAAMMLEHLDAFRQAYRRLPAEYQPGGADRLAASLLAGA